MPGSAVPPKLSASVRKVNLIVPSGLLERVDEFRKHLPGLPNRSVAIRKLMEMGLDTAEKKPSKGKKG
jgi:hypothetical protein